mgnify:CR=1 FL=1
MKHKRSGRVTALLLSAVLTLCLLPLPVKAAGAEAGVQLGDYIQLGRYEGEPILWRCVSVDENGPLMLSDRVLCDSMPYDAQTSENSASGSHRRSSYRSKYGSNHWRDSDMRSWLNSDADAGQVEWLCGNPPKDGYILGGGAYDGKAGFLNGFTRDEAAAIKTVTQRSIVSHPEYTAGYIDAPGADLPYNTDIGSVADGYEGAHYENITDKVFLLDVKQLHTVYENLGGYYIGQNRSGVSWNYWLRTPVTDCNHDMRYVSPQGSIGRDAPCKGYYGVRPAFYLDTAYYAVTSGSGTAADPYVGAAPSKPADSTPLSPAERDTGDGNWDVDTETYLQVEMSERYTTDREYANPTIPVYVIQKPRSDTENMVILFCAEGYTKSQQADFIKDVQQLWQATLNTEPYRSMADRFNVYALCTASKDGFNGSSTFFQANKNGISVNYGGWRNHILERIIGTSFLEKIHDAHIPNTTMPEADEYRQYDYVYEHINQFVVLANSGEYFGGSHDEIKSGIHYILAAAKHNDSPFILRHELGHGLFHLGDEYATSTTPVGEESYRASLNISHTADPTQVKWKNMLGFRNTYSCPHTDNSYVYNSSFECLMRENRRNEFCDVCALQGTKRMSQLISDPPALYAAVPEVKLYTGSYRNPTENADAYRQANYSGYWSYQRDRESRLLSGSYKNRLSPSMKGQEIELRTIVQNLSDTEEQTVTLRLWVQHTDGSRTLTADGGDVGSEKVFTVPVWSEKSKFWPKGALEYTGSDFDSGLANCSLVYRIPENAQLQSGDTIGFEVVDGAGNILANDRTENQTYTAVTVRYALEDGTAMPNTAPSVLPVPTGASVNWQPPQTLNGHAFVNMKDNGSTVTFVYQETSEQPEVKTYTVRYVWGEAPSDRTLPTDNRAYRSVEQAMDAVDTTFTAGSTSNAQNGGLTGTWAFSGWDNGTLEGTTVVFRGTWRFTPGGGSTGGTTPSQPGGSTGGSSGGGGSSSGSSGGSSSGGGGSAGGGSAGGGSAGGGSAGGGSAATPAKPETSTKPDGSSVTESKTPDGSTGTVKTDKNGQTTAETKLSAKALEDAKKNGEAVKAPVEVEATRNSNTAPTVSIELPKGAGETKVEIPVSNANSGTVAVLVHPDGTEEILKSSLPTENGIQLTVNGGATVKIIDNSKDFADTQNHWAKDDVDFVAARELFNGVGGNRFDVSGSMTRGMVNTVLARLAGANTEGGAKWYDKGTEWAVQRGISDGTNPTAPVTREQLAAMLYRFAGAPAVSGALNFNDANAVSEYARSALLWATQNGILNGVGGNLAAPAALAERAQVAAMLARYLRSAG